MTTRLQIGNGSDWSFMNGEWSDGPDGELMPPDGTKVEYLAVRTDEAWADFDARFRFKMRAGGCGARLPFRLQDARRFYALDVPWCGQQSRARHFWAGLVIADGTPLQRYLSFNLVPGLCAVRNRWYDARVQAAGPRLRAWIDDILVADVQNETYASGRLGLAGIMSPYPEAPHFLDVEIDGEPVAPADWPGLEAPRPHWITPCPETDPKAYQSYANMIRSKSGEITLYLTFGNPNHGETRRSVFIRSSDGGRTWGAPGPATLQQGLGANFVRRDGTWVCVFRKQGNDEQPFYSHESDDDGRSWSAPEPLVISGSWLEGWEPLGPTRPVRLRNGSVLLPVLAKYVGEPKSELARGMMVTPFVLRSEDDGRTWSAPVRCDTQNMDPGEPIDPESMWHALAGFLCEVEFAEARDNVVLGIGRPFRDIYMWQVQSNDGGRTWEPAAIGHFPGYCPSLTSTAGGALVATTRFPYFAARLSRDGGRTWEPPVIVDYPMWANQQALEVEPDVVLVTYMGDIMEPGRADSRIARLRVTDDALRLDH